MIKEAIKILKKSGIVVYPTDTAYGLAVDATNLSAVKKLYRLKGRNFNKPIHVIVPMSKLSNTPEYWSKWLRQVVKLNVPAKKLIRKFWPGPLTIVLPLKSKGKSWKLLSGGTNTIGIRYPDHPMAQALVEAFAKPITTTSANLAGKDNTYSVFQVQKQFGNSKLKPDFYLDGGKLKKIKPSTVVKLNGNVTILREGPISKKQIDSLLKNK